MRDYVAASEALCERSFVRKTIEGVDVRSDHRPVLFDFELSRVRCSRMQGTKKPIRWRCSDKELLNNLVESRCG